MSRPPKFRSLLPTVQGTITILFAGWGLWWRSRILSHSVFGWNSTVLYDVWPWPTRFALILNVPALITGALALWPVERFARTLPEGLEAAVLLAFVFVLWRWVGQRFDRRWQVSDRAPLGVLLAFASACLTLALLPIGPDYFLYGVGLWLVAIAALISATRGGHGNAARSSN